MKASWLRWLCLALMMHVKLVCAGDVLAPGTVLINNGAIESANKQYKLIMQSDGSLVMYRADGSVRYRMAKQGRFATMQTDGNFVEYDAFPRALWNTGTNGFPGAYLLIQDDGNLVVYSARGQALWNIGAEQQRGAAPTRPADVVGRDLASNGLAYFGHVGMWDGANVVEAMPIDGNAIRYTRLSDFRAASQYWGVASAEMPSYYIFACFEAYCPHSSENPARYYTSRQAAVARARQIFLIGADYSLQIPQFRIAQAGDQYRAPLRGIYRCDTFVWDLLLHSVNTEMVSQAGSLEAHWASNVYRMNAAPFYPRALFDRLNAVR